jgi:hypothetical protein
MLTEVYLLSIPLARHRNIVPRRRDAGLAPGASRVRPLEQRVHGVADGIAESPPHPGTLPRFDPH